LLRIILVAFYLTSLLNAVDIKLIEKSNNIEINSIKYLKNNNYLISDLKNKQFNTYEKKPNQLFTFPFETVDSYWIMFNIENQTDVNQERLLYITYPDIQNIEFFEKTLFEGKFQEIEKNSKIKRVFTASIELQAKEKKTVALKIDNELAPIVFNIKVLSEEESYKIEQNTQILHSIYIGLMIFASIYFVIAFTLMKKYIYIIYVLHIVSFVLFQIFVQGYPKVYFSELQFLNETKVLTPLIAISSYAFFVVLFLKDSLLDKYKYIIYTLLIMVLVSIVLYLFGIISPKPIALFGVLEYIVILLASFSAFLRGNKFAFSIFISSIALVLGVVYHALSIIMQVIPLYEYSLYAISYSNMFEVIVILFMFVTYFKKTYEDKEKIYLQKLELEHSFAKELDKEVKAKTKELFLEKKKAESLARTDDLTQLLNRRAFIQEAEYLIKEAKRYEVSLSFMLIDIDHFKKINDTYGHEAGDKVLKDFSQKMLSLIRETDIVARIGGEEFVMIFPHTDKQMSVYIASKIQKNINEMKVEFQDKVLNITASFGISSLNSQADTVTTLLSQADAALYKAKNNGRNTIEVS